MAQSREREHLGTVLGFWAWRWRTELALLAALTLAIHYTARATNGTIALATVLLVIAALTSVPNTRAILVHVLHAARVRRAWSKAVHRSGAADPHPRRSNRPDPILGPRATRVREVPAGDLVHVRAGRGSSIARLLQCQPELETTLRAPVEITPDPRDPSRASVLIRRRDPFTSAAPVPWPPLHDGLDQLSVWDPVTFGYDENGGAVTHRLVGGGHILIGGITGGGKSVAFRPLLATAALSTDPCVLWLFDAKLIELAPWAPAARELVGRDGKRALQVLQSLQAVADERQREVLATGGDKIRRSSGLPVHFVVVDELANFAELPEGAKIMMALRDLASRGRALGITLIVATQVPHSDLIDTTLRNQFSRRIAFRCADRHHAGTILGQSDVAQLAAQISDRLPGVGYALGETGAYVRFRSVFVGRPDDDHPDRPDDVLAVVECATAMGVDREFGVMGSGLDSPLRGETRDPARGPRVADPPAASKRAETETLLLEHLGETPVSRKELARRLGRSPDDATVRRALTRMLEDGRAFRSPTGWTRTPLDNL